ncbi:MAG: hypothetical protein Q4D53_00290 [Leptotrichiaceae bacterium]|nr:hypothetical protein [Leptotrichiaceae bacterium]
MKIFIKIFLLILIQFIFIPLALIIGISTEFYIPFKAQKEPIDLNLSKGYELLLYKNGITKLKIYDSYLNSEEFLNSQDYKTFPADRNSDIRYKRSIFTVSKLARYIKKYEENGETFYHDYIGYITDEQVEIKDRAGNIRIEESNKNLGYFYSDDRNDTIEFGVSEKELKEKYGKDVIKKMKSAKKIMKRYGDDGLGNKDEMNIIYIRSIWIWIIINCLYCLTSYFKKKKLLEK